MMPTRSSVSSPGYSLKAPLLLRKSARQIADEHPRSCVAFEQASIPIRAIEPLLTILLQERFHVRGDPFRYDFLREVPDVGIHNELRAGNVLVETVRIARRDDRIRAAPEDERRDGQRLDVARQVLGRTIAHRDERVP